MVASINQRWPRDLCPTSCTFTRSRNDIPQISPRTRKQTLIRQGRPLWSAKCTWQLPNTARLAKLRYTLEGLEGMAGSVQIWDFSSPYPYGIEASVSNGNAVDTRLRWTYLAAQYPFTAGGLPSHWTYGGTVPTANVSAAIGATAVGIGGLQANRYAALQGQYVQIGRRIYLVAADVVAGATGFAVVPLQTPLLSAVAVGDQVRFVEAACEMQLAEQMFDQNSEAGRGLTIVSASFIETVEDLT